MGTIGTGTMRTKATELVDRHDGRNGKWRASVKLGEELTHVKDHHKDHQI